MNIDFLYNYVSLVWQIVLNEMLMRGVSPVDAQNLVATLLNMMTQAAL